MSNSIPLDADSGYQGIEEYHSNSFIPIKSSKNHQLTEEEKAYNKELARRRVVIEHINAKLNNHRLKAVGFVAAESRFEAKAS
jgi:hypothetical protein